MSSAIPVKARSAHKIFRYHDNGLTNRPTGGRTANEWNAFGGSWNWEVDIWPLMVRRHVTHFLLTIRPFFVPYFRDIIDEMGGNILDHLAEPIEASFDVLTRDFKSLLLHGNFLTSLETPLSIEHMSNRIRVYRFRPSVDDLAEDLDHSS
jgi:hypothetical protein